VQMGYRTVLVLSGGPRREDLSRFAYRPDVVVDSIADLCDWDLPTVNPAKRPRRRKLAVLAT
jgi:ribonucleotide monophosphatase NagD (HAD superfamily)